MKTINNQLSVRCLYTTIQYNLAKKKLRNYLLILCFAIGHIYGYSQKQKYVDSLTTVYNKLEDGKPKIKLAHKLFKLTVHKNKPSAFKYANEQLNLSEDINYTKGVGTAYRDLAYYYQYLPIADSARHYYKKSVANFKDNGNRERLCTALDRFATFETVEGNYETALQLVDEYLAIGRDLKHGYIITDGLQRKSTIYLNLADYASALDVVMESIKIADTMSPKYLSGIAKGLSDIGRIESIRSNYNKALESAKKALSVFKEVKDLKRVGITQNQIGNIYYELKDYSKALEFYKKAVAISESNNRKDRVAIYKSNVAMIYSKQGYHDKALKLMKEANDIINSVGTMSNKIIGYGAIAGIYMKQNNYAKALSNYTTAIHKADSVNALEDLYGMYKKRSIAYEKIGDYKKSLSDYKSYKNLYDSIFNMKSEKHISELKTIYETQKKETELIKKEGEIKLLEERKQKHDSQRLFLLLSLIGAIALAGAIVYALRQKMKRNTLIREQLDTNLAFKEKELTTHALHLAHKNEILMDLKSQLKTLKGDANSRNLQNAINTINIDINNDTNWEHFKTYFEEVHKDFNTKILQQYSKVTANDLRLMALLKMNLSSKEIANILNISLDGVKKARYRLRKKLGLSANDSLEKLIIEL